MRSIAGEARTGMRPFQIDQAKADSGSIVDYPPNFGRQAPTPAKTQRQGV